MRRLSTSSVVIGVDPGGRETGIVLVNRGHLVDHEVITLKAPPKTWPTREYLDAVVAAVRSRLDEFDADLVTLEGLKEPNPHLGMTSTRGLISTATVFGAVQITFECEVVQPGGHGLGPPGAYPEAIRIPAGGKGNDKLRHCRSAYDIAHVGLITASRAQAASA